MDLHRQLRELLEQAGCYYDRPGKGSHDVWYSPITKRRFPIPYRGHLKDRNLANEILKQAGLQSISKDFRRGRPPDQLSYQPADPLRNVARTLRNGKFGPRQVFDDLYGTRSLLTMSRIWLRVPASGAEKNVAMGWVL